MKYKLIYIYDENSKSHLSWVSFLHLHNLISYKSTFITSINKNACVQVQCDSTYSRIQSDKNL